MQIGDVSEMYRRLSGKLLNMNRFCSVKMSIFFTNIFYLEKLLKSLFLRNCVYCNLTFLMFFINETASAGAQKASVASVWTPAETETGIERSERA